MLLFRSKSDLFHVTFENITQRIRHLLRDSYSIKVTVYIIHQSGLARNGHHRNETICQTRVHVSSRPRHQ